ncbi:MAG: PD-(D/E)XK nuclease family protein, partial [Brevibacterium aurantiacum]
MHQGTHEKQLSNIFAWLLTVDGTHGLEDKFQQTFITRVNGRVHSDN